MDEAVIHAQVHRVLPWTLLGFKSGKFSLYNNHGLEEIFSHAALPELKSVLFCDVHMLPNTEEAVEEEPTIMVAICAKQICTVDTCSSSSTLIRISPELETGVSLTGAVVQLDLENLLLGTNVGNILCYSLKLRSLVKLAGAGTKTVHPITMMVPTCSLNIISAGGDSFLSVWGLAKVPTTKTYSLSHQRKIMFPSAAVVIDLTCDNEYLLCRFANQTTLVWQMQAATERLLYKLSSVCEMPKRCSAFLYCEASFLTVQHGKLLSAIPQSVARRIASSLENGIVLSGTSPTFQSNNGVEEEHLIAIRMVAQVAQTKIIKFWQHPALAGWLLVQCEDFTLRIINVHCDVRPTSVAGDFNVVGNVLMRKNEVLCYLHLTCSSSEEFLVQKEALLRCTENPVEGEIVEAFWHGPVALQMIGDYLMVYWKQQHQFAVLTNLNNTGVKTVLTGEGAVAFAFEQPRLLVIKHVQEPTLQAAAATTTAETAVGKLFRRGSTPTIIRKRLSLPPVAAVPQKIKTVLTLHHLTGRHPDAYTEVDIDGVDNIDDIACCGGNLFALRNKTSTKFYHLVDGKMFALSTTLPRHLQVAVWHHSRGTTLAFTCQALRDRIVIVDIVDSTTIHSRCQVVIATNKQEVCSMHWHYGTLLFTTADCKVHIAFVGFQCNDDGQNVMSWVLAQRILRDTPPPPPRTTSKRALIHVNANPNDPRHSPATLACPGGVWLTVKEVRGEDVVLQDQHGNVYVARLLANKLIKVGMLASAGLGESALKWALALEDQQQLKDVAVSLLQRLGFPKRACGVIGASPQVLLNVMITHGCIDEACLVFHPSRGVLQVLQKQGELSDCERLALFFATQNRFDCVQWVVDALHDKTGFCAGLLKRVINQ